MKKTVILPCLLIGLLLPAGNLSAQFYMEYYPMDYYSTTYYPTTYYSIDRTNYRVDFIFQDRVWEMNATNSFSFFNSFSSFVPDDPFAPTLSSGDFLTADLTKLLGLNFDPTDEDDPDDPGGSGNGSGGNGFVGEYPFDMHAYPLGILPLALLFVLSGLLFKKNTNKKLSI